MDILLPTRLLIQANSGGGKSYLLRRMVEQLFGKVQMIIIDPEGEFATLREKFDFVLVGKGGETPADPRSAALVAEKLLQLNASAVCDIYEMKQGDRHRWVRLFLDAMINAPKTLWHPCVVIVDEAHVYCPEKGQGESEAYGAMIDLATRGRKRGFCAVFATQRLGKLSKNASAELQNVLIGSTFQDIDRKRAAETLGVAKSDERQFFNEIKLLEPGNFFALGRAISRDRICIAISKVETTHPQQGKYKSTPPPPTDKVRALLPKLGDLPKEAEDKARSEAELRKEITELKRQIKALPVSSGANPKEIIDLKQIIKEREGTIRSLIKIRDELVDKLVKVRAFTENIPTKEKIIADRERVAIIPPSVSKRPLLPKDDFNRKIIDSSNGSLGKAERKILTALAQYPEGRQKTQIAILTGYSHRGGSFNNALSACRSQGYAVGSDHMKITQEGIEALGSYDPLPEGEELFAHWMGSVGKAEKSILSVVKEAYPNAISKEDVAIGSGYEVSGGSFNNALSRLRSLELISGSKEIVLSDNLI